MPKSRRPPLITSTLAPILAASAGLAVPVQLTICPSRMRRRGLGERGHRRPALEHRLVRRGRARCGSGRRPRSSRSRAPRRAAPSPGTSPTWPPPRRSGQLHLPALRREHPEPDPTVIARPPSSPSSGVRCVRGAQLLRTHRTRRGSVLVHSGDGERKGPGGERLIDGARGPAAAARESRSPRRGGRPTRRSSPDGDGPARDRRAGAAGRAVRARHVRRDHAPPAPPATSTRSSPASSTCSTTPSCRTRCPRTCADGSSSSRWRSRPRFNEFRGEIDGRRVDDNEILAGPARRATTAESAARAWEASKKVGAAVAGDVRDARAVAQRGRAGPRLPRPLRRSRSRPAELDEDRLFATLAEVDDATRGAVRGVEGRRSTPIAPPASAARVDELRPVALRRPVLPGPAGRRPRAASTTCSPSADLEALTLRTYDGLGLDVRPVLERSDLYAARRQEPARVLHPHRPVRRRARAVQRRAQRPLGRDDAPRVRPRRLRPGARRRRCRGSCASPRTR